ncbi:B12-binding domain-containing radical SAM protein [Thermodesulfobacteriota bacterium]
MKVLFIQLTAYGMSSHGLLSLADSLNTRGHEVGIIGTPTGVRHLVENPEHSKLLDDAIKGFQADIFGISTMTPDADLIPRLSEYLKRAHPDTPIICGGYHALVYQEKVLEQNENLDFVFYGEAEEHFPTLLDKLGSGTNSYEEINGLIYRRGGTLFKNPIGAPCHFDEPIPLRAFDFTFMDIYNTGKTTTRALTTPMLPPTASFLLSRGCPYRCTFCQLYPSNPYCGMRHLTPSAFKKHLTYALQRRAIRSLFIHDSSFDLNKKWAHEIIEIIAETQDVVEWACYLRPNLVTEDFLKLLKESRCSTVLLYLEGGTERIRNSILNKKVTDEQVKRAFALARRHGFLVKTNVILGCPTETEEELYDGLRLLSSVDPDSAAFPCLTIMPGTELWENYKGKMIVENYKDFDIGSTPDNMLRKDRRVYFGEANPELVLDLKNSLNRYFSGFAGLCRKRIRLEDNSALFLAILSGHELTDAVGLLSHLLMNSGKRKLAVLAEQGLDLDQLVFTSEIDRFWTKAVPTEVDLTDEIWDQLRQEGFDVIVAPTNQAVSSNVLKKLPAIAMTLGAGYIFLIDSEEQILFEYDSRLKSLAQIRIEPSLETVAKGEYRRTITKYGFQGVATTYGPSPLKQAVVDRYKRIVWSVKKGRLPSVKDMRDMFADLVKLLSG